jgi:hypothetical protein
MGTCSTKIDKLALFDKGVMMFAKQYHLEAVYKDAIESGNRDLEAVVGSSLSLHTEAHIVGNGLLTGFKYYPAAETKAQAQLNRDMMYARRNQIPIVVGNLIASMGGGSKAGPGKGIGPAPQKAWGAPLEPVAMPAPKIGSMPAPNFARVPSARPQALELTSNAPHAAAPAAATQASSKTPGHSVILKGASSPAIDSNVLDMVLLTKAGLLPELAAGVLKGVDNLTIVAHGNETHIDINGKLYTPVELAAHMVFDAGWEGGNITLASCNTGNCGSVSSSFRTRFEQALKLMGSPTKVLAPKGRVALVEGVPTVVDESKAPKGCPILIDDDFFPAGQGWTSRNR